MPQVLTEGNRAKLDGIVQQMVANGEPDDAIQFVVSDFKQKYALPEKPASAEDFTGPEPSTGQKALRVLGGLGRSVFGGAAETASALSDLQRGTLGGDVGALNRTTGRIRGIVGAQADQFRKAGNSQTASEAIGHGVAGLLPVVGPAAAAVGEKAETDPYGAAGEALGMIGAPAIVRGAVRTAQAIPAAGRAAAGAARGVVEPVARGLMSDTPVLTQLRKGATKKILGRLIAKEPSPNAGGRLNTTKAPTAEAAIAEALSDLDTADVAGGVELPPTAELPPGYRPRTSAPAPKAAPTAAPSPNAGGRLVREPSLTFERELADALSERVPEPPARITTPPQRDLPPGYTPRTTVPKPKMAKATMEAAPAQKSPTSSPVPAQSKAPTPAKRSTYFLRTPEEIAALTSRGESVAPLGRALTPDDLPLVLRGRVTQRLAGPSASGASPTDITSELGGRGMSITDAMDSVQRDASLAPNVRLQLQDVLVAALMGK